MLVAFVSAVEAGILFSIMALGVYLSFRILNFPDLTVDGSFVTGAGVAAVLLLRGAPPFIAMALAMIAGFLAGTLTGILHAWGRINQLLSGILMMIALYSINLRIMGRPNVTLLNQRTVFTDIETWAESMGLGNLISQHGIVIIFSLMIALLLKLCLDWFLQTEIGLAIRATGDNPRMIRSFSANTKFLIVLGLGLANAFVAFSGALIAQYNGSADIGMGIGMIVIGLASVIIGEAIFGTRSLIWATSAVIGGAIIYRVVLAFALRSRLLETGDVKLITAIIVIAALIVPNILRQNPSKKRRKQDAMFKLSMKFRTNDVLLRSKEVQQYGQKTSDASAE